MGENYSMDVLERRQKFPEDEARYVLVQGFGSSRCWMESIHCRRQVSVIGIWVWRICWRIRQGRHWWLILECVSRFHSWKRRRRRIECSTSISTSSISTNHRSSIRIKINVRQMGEMIFLILVVKPLLQVLWITERDNAVWSGHSSLVERWVHVHVHVHKEFYSYIEYLLYSHLYSSLVSFLIFISLYYQIIYYIYDYIYMIAILHITRSNDQSSTIWRVCHRHVGPWSTIISHGMWLSTMGPSDRRRWEISLLLGGTLPADGPIVEFGVERGYHGFVAEDVLERSDAKIEFGTGEGTSMDGWAWNASTWIISYDIQSV